MGLLEKLFGPSEVEKLKEAKDVEGLVGLLRKNNVDTIQKAWLALWDLHDKRTVVPLIQVLQAHATVHPYACIKAIDLLGELGDKRAVTPIIQVLGTYPTDCDVVSSSVKALAQIDDKRAAEVADGVIRVLLEGETWGYSEIDIFDKIGEPAVEALTEALDDENEKVRKRAKQILKSIQKRRKIEENG